jgi:arginyl-tRNA synthetase
MDAEGTILQALKNALEKLGIHDVEPVLEHPDELSHGDYATSAALAAAKAAGKNPKVLAEEIVAVLGDIDGVEKIEIAGPGFINFYLSRGYFPSSIKRILDAGEDWGKNEHVKGYKVMVEYTDPNPFKEFHIGHLMSNATGEAIARFTEFCGAEVRRANWQGDVGPHVAKAIWGKMQKPELSWGEAYTYGAQEYEASKEAIDEINKQVYERSSEQVNALYDTGRKESLAHFEEIYAVLGTKFDYYFFEGTEGLEGIPLVKEGLKKGIFEESDGAVVFRGEKYGLHTRVFLTAKGLPTYEAKELGLNKAKFEKEPDVGLSIIVTANEQSSYFEVVLEAMKQVLPEIAQKTVHIDHGMMQLTSGKMSSRKGNIITGESLIEEMREKALAKMSDRDLGGEKQNVADMVAVAAIKYSILKQARGKNIIFDPEASLSFEGDSGPYLQYSHVRALSVLRKAKEEGVSARATEAPEETTELERLLYRFPEVVFRAAKEYEPHYVTTYLTELAAVFNGWYAKGKIVDTEDQFSPYKVAVTQAFATTMKNGLWLLGIQVPERM